MTRRLFLSGGLTAIVFYCFTMASSYQGKPENNAPKVTITTPLKNSKFQWNSIVPYSIRVVDQEDGSSAFNEIPPHEVLLMVRYFPDSSQVKKYLLDRAKTNPEPLLWMRTSTCFNCHAAKAKLIGPSFEQIAKRYPYTSASVEALSNKIVTGTTGTWGDVIMPPHPDLKIEQTRKIVSWILKNSLDPDQNYFVGTEGAFRIKEKSERDTKKSVYVLTASYIDHGLQDVPNSRKQDQHSVVLKNF